MANHFDMSNHQIDIDKVIDTYLLVQKEHGRDVSLEEKDFEKAIIKPTEEEKCDSTKCSSCKSKCSKSTDDNVSGKEKKTNLMSGIFVDDEEEQEDYICEYCTAIGYSQKYDSDLCDECTTCETCSEYLDGECDGCSYSVFRDGEYYHSKLGLEQLLCSEDLDMINSIGERKELTRSEPTSFTVLKY